MCNIRFCIKNAFHDCYTSHDIFIIILGYVLYRHFNMYFIKCYDAIDLIVWIKVAIFFLLYNIIKQHDAVFDDNK